MRKNSLEGFALCFAVLMLLVASGCEKGQQSDMKKARLVAQENRQLKEQFAVRDAMIEKQKQLIAECEADKELLKKNSDEKITEMIGFLSKGTGEENTKLRRENEILKFQLAELKK